MLDKLTRFLFRNTSTRQTVAKNTFWASVSQFGGRAIRLAIIVYAARALGAAEYGLFSYAISLVSFMGMFMDPGVNSVMVRDIAKASECERLRIFSAALTLKVGLVLVGSAIIIFAGPYFSTLPGARQLLPLAGLILIFDTLREFFVSLARGAEQLEWDAGISILTNTAIVTFAFAYLMEDRTAKSLALGYALGAGIGALAAIILMRRYFSGVVREYSCRLIVPILQSAWPLAVTGALATLSTNADVLIISWMRTAADVGVYAAAVRIIQVIYLLPVIVQVTTLPLFSRLAGRENAEFRRALERMVCTLLCISLPITVGGIVLGAPILTLIFGSAFVAGVPAFKILLASVAIGFPGSIILNAIFACGHQRAMIMTSVIAGVTNVLLDLVLIPTGGITGSAIATLISVTVANAYVWYVMKKLVHFEVLQHLGRILIASSAVGLTAILLMHVGVNVIVNIIVSASVYAMTLWFFHEPILSDLRAIAFQQGFPSQTEPV